MDSDDRVMRYLGSGLQGPHARGSASRRSSAWSSAPPRGRGTDCCTRACATAAASSAAAGCFRCPIRDDVEIAYRLPDRMLGTGLRDRDGARRARARVRRRWGSHASSGSRGPRTCRRSACSRRSACARGRGRRITDARCASRRRAVTRPGRRSRNAGSCPSMRRCCSRTRRARPRVARRASRRSR